MINSFKFKKFKTVRTLKIQKTTKIGPKKFLQLNDYEKPTKKEERKKKATFQNLLFFSFVLFCIFFIRKSNEFAFIFTYVIKPLLPTTIYINY